MKFHINKHGVPAPCKAKVGNCPLGGDELHFDNIEEAQRIADKLAESEHGILPRIIVEDCAETPEANFRLLEENKFGISKEWHDKFLSHDDFDEFAMINASDVIRDKLFENKDNIYEKTMNLWKDIHYENSLSSLRKLDEQEAVDIVRENMNLSHITGWFREYNSNYKPKIENSIMTNPELRNASLNIAHRVYQESTGNNISYNEFLHSEIEVYRGGNFNFIDSDVFISYSFDKEIAKKFAKGGKVESIKVRIKDTLGSLQTTGEAELMVRNRLS